STLARATFSSGRSVVPILSVPLKAMCSNMWARPVWPMGSCAEPAFTWVLNEKTGASGRSHMTTVRPLSSFLTVMRFSKADKSCAKAIADRTRSTATVLSARYFIGPPRRLDRTLQEELEVTWREGKLSNLTDVDCVARAPPPARGQGQSHSQKPRAGAPAPHYTKRREHC